MTRLPYEQIVFSGGGIRCFWHGGWMAAVSQHCTLAPDRVIGVSGGVLSAAAWLSGREETLLEVMSDAFSDEDTNVTWDDFDESEGLTPHQRVYGSVVATTLDDTAQKRIANGPVFQVFVGRPKGRGPDLLQALTGGLAYQIEKKMGGAPKSDLPRRFGITGDRIDGNAAAHEGCLPELVLAAATIPPIFRLSNWGDAAVVDGGMIDQAPLPEPDSGKTLVLLTRNYDEAPEDTDRITHILPSDPVLDTRIDFTDPGKLREAWDKGLRDGEAFLNTLT